MDLGKTKRKLRPGKIWVLATAVWISYATLATIFGVDIILSRNPVYFFVWVVGVPISALIAGLLVRRIYRGFH